MKAISILIVIACAVGLYFYLQKGEETGSSGKGSSVNLDNLTVTPGVGIGPVKFGMSRDEVIRLLGKPEFDMTGSISYPSKGFDLFVGETHGVRMISCCTKQIYLSSPMVKNAADFKGSTDKGIKIGSTERQIIAAYGNPTRRSKGVRGGTSLRYKKLGANFELQNGKLVQIMLSKR